VFRKPDEDPNGWQIEATNHNTASAIRKNNSFIANRRKSIFRHDYNTTERICDCQRPCPAVAAITLSTWVVSDITQVPLSSKRLSELFSTPGEHQFLIQNTQSLAAASLNRLYPQVLRPSGLVPIPNRVLA
jgi:hypothetical protein